VVPGSANVPGVERDIGTDAVLEMVDRWNDRRWPDRAAAV